MKGIIKIRINGGEWDKFKEFTFNNYREIDDHINECIENVVRILPIPINEINYLGRCMMDSDHNLYEFDFDEI